MKPFNDNKLYRLPAIVKPHGKFPMGSSTWWGGVKSGRYPKPIKLGPRISAWRGFELNNLITSLTGAAEYELPIVGVRPRAREDPD